MPSRTKKLLRSLLLASLTLAFTGFFVGFLLAQSKAGSDAGTRPDAGKEAHKGPPPVPSPPPAFDDVPVPDDNPTTPEKVALGKRLFFDKRLSGDGSRSCYSCHVCEKGLTDGLPTAVGAFDKILTRSSPTLWNIGYHDTFYWDGRSDSLEKQGMAAWKGANMGADPEAVVKQVNEIEGYAKRFGKVFGGSATPENVVKALSAFERTIFCGATRYDKFEQGEESALSDDEKRGYELFRGKAGCGTCHAGILFTDLLFHNVGIGMDVENPDIGRKKVTEKEADTGAFKTPTLRDISRSAPYFHDGSAATLADAVETMAGGGKPNPYLDKTNLQDHKLTAQEKTDLVSFLTSLDCPCDLKEPKLP